MKTLHMLSERDSNTGTQRLRFALSVGKVDHQAEVKETVSNILDAELPGPYTPELFSRKTEAVYQHIYDSYYGEGKSIYTEN